DGQEVVSVCASNLVEVWVARARLAGEVASALPWEVGLASVRRVAVDQTVVVPFPIALATEVQAFQAVLDAVLGGQGSSRPDDEPGVVAGFVEEGSRCAIGKS